MPPINASPEGKELVDLYNKEFVNYQAVITDTSVNTIVAKFHPTVFPFYIFFDSHGGPIYKSGANNIIQDRFRTMANRALELLSSGKTYNHYDRLDKANMLNKEQIREYIVLRQSLDMYDNALLIEKYVDLLQIKDLDDYSEILFVLNAGPHFTGKAYKLAYTNSKIIDSIFKTEPLDIRVALNAHMINNSRNEAIRTKNLSMAQTVAQFASKTWNNNYQEANKTNTKEMLMYYKGVKDTTRYFQQAGFFYDTYYLNITTDSARRLQAEQMAKIRTTAQNSILNSGVLPPGATLQVVQLSPAKTLEVANVLNNAAYEFYTMGTHNPTHLTKALIWSRRSIQLNPEAAYYDTMAHIMYRLGFYDEAILNQNKAVEMASKQANLPGRLENLKAELNKMKTRQL